MTVAIASGKGGTGKTTLATNLSSHLAESRPVVLVDLDVEEPNSGLFIRSALRHREDTFRPVPVWDQQQCSLCGLCAEVCNFHAIIRIGEQIMVFPELCHSCHACSELCPADALPMNGLKMGTLTHSATQALSLVESRLDVGQEQAVPLIAQTIAYVERTFPDNALKVFDAPPGTACPVTAATKSADVVILVTEPTPFGLHDLKLAVETMRELGKRFAVVVNRYGIGNDTVLDYCRTEEIDVVAKLPNSRRVAELYSRGDLVYTEIPEIARELDNIESYLAKVERGVAW
jgi:MinD superfamily P-loop ATPase